MTANCVVRVKAMPQCLTNEKKYSRIIKYGMQREGGFLAQDAESKEKAVIP